MTKVVEMKSVLHRQDANRKILELLSALVEAYPSYRFGQILFNMQVVQSQGFKNGSHQILDPFYEESESTLERLENNVNNIEC